VVVVEVVVLLGYVMEPQPSLLLPPLLFSVALPAVEVPRKSVWPPFAKLSVPPLWVMVALPAVEKCVASVPKNCVKPPFAPPTVAPLLLIVALPALEVSKNRAAPPPAPLTVPPLLVKVVTLPGAFVTVALLVKCMNARLPDPSTAVTKFCVIPELLVMPVPLMVNVIAGLTVIVKECVSIASNVIAAIEFAGVAETKREVTLDKSWNVAVSPAVVPG